MKDRIDAALRAAKPLQEQIRELKKGIGRDDPRYEMIDDAELGMKWVTERLKNLAKFTLKPSDANHWYSTK